jgi:Uma2 family endonuclease
VVSIDIARVIGRAGLGLNGTGEWGLLVVELVEPAAPRSMVVDGSLALAASVASLPNMTAHALATISAEELWRLPEDGQRRELVEGHLRVMTPAGAEHGRVASTANWLLSAHVHPSGMGVTFGAETGFVLASDPDTVRAPDAAFVTRARADAVGRTERYWPGAPDFAVEVVSPHDGFGEVEAKALGWLSAGTSAVLVLDPARRSATVYRARGDARAYDGDEEIDLSDAVPDWRIAVADFFA